MKTGFSIKAYPFSLGTIYAFETPRSENRLVSSRIPSTQKQKASAPTFYPISNVQTTSGKAPGLLCAPSFLFFFFRNLYCNLFIFIRNIRADRRPCRLNARGSLPTELRKRQDCWKPAGHVATSIDTVRAATNAKLFCTEIEIPLGPAVAILACRLQIRARACWVCEAAGERHGTATLAGFSAPAC